MSKKTQKADVRQQFELARVLLSIIPKLDLTRGDILQQVEGARHLEEILRLVFRVDPRTADVSRLKTAFRFRFSPEARRYLEQSGYTIVETKITDRQEFLYRQHCRLERSLAIELKVMSSFLVKSPPEGFSSIPVEIEEIAWMPSDPIVPGTLGEVESIQMLVLWQFAKQILKETQGWARAMRPTLELVVPLLFDHSEQAGEFPFSSLFTRVNNVLSTQKEGSGRRIRRNLAVGEFQNREKGPVVVVKDVQEAKHNLGILRLIRPS